MKKIAILLFIAFLSSCEKKQLLQPTSNPASVGVATEKLAEIDKYILDAISEKRIPGGTFLLAKNGKIVYDKSFGLSNSSINKAYTNDDIYRLASMTKAVTSVSIMQLYEQGKIDLDEPVYNYIPSFKDQVVLDTFEPSDSTFTTVPVEKAITIRNLLTHTSGIVYGSFNPGKLMAVYEKFDMNVGFSHPTWSTEEWIDKLAKVPLAHQPGARFSYGLNMDVLGRIIEVVSGQPLDVYFKENIFDKVGMPDSYFYLPNDKFERLVPVYMKVRGEYKTADELGLTAGVDYPKQGPRNLFAGGAGLSSTAMDYAKFLETLVTGGGNLLGAKAMEEMTKNQLPIVINDYENYPKGSDGGFALGFQLYEDLPTKKSPKSPGTYEWGGYFNTKFFIDPKEQMIFVGMTQVSGFNDNQFWNELYELVYNAIEG